MEKVLLIDDDADIRRIGQLSLRRCGVLLAASGAEGVALAAREQPTVILLDVMMPEMDGKATLQALASQPATAHIPVIFLTAKAHPQDVEAYLALGAAGVIQKPFDPLRLPDEVRRILQDRQPR